jgi:hypothetical protein
MATFRKPFRLIFGRPRMAALEVTTLVSIRFHGAYRFSTKSGPEETDQRTENHGRRGRQWIVTGWNAANADPTTTPNDTKNIVLSTRLKLCRLVNRMTLQADVATPISKMTNRFVVREGRKDASEDVA